MLPQVVKAVGDTTPLTHNMTNLVVQNFAANVALCIGASPIMANYAEEAADLAKLGGALVVNMGTVTPEGLKSYAQAAKAYNHVGGPVVFDPVGAGATSVRRQAVKDLLASCHFTVIKGNVSEIQTVAGASIVQRGVDSSSSLTLAQKASLVRALARRRRNVILMTGATDLVSDGTRTFRVDNGHALLASVTGTGCTLGTTVSAMVAAHRGDVLVATVAAVVVFGVAAERAAAREEVRGPGTFVPAFLDELYAIRRETGEGDLAWLARARVQAVEVEKEEL
ncbi:hypothetical protein G7046_g9913 [Stylonectria norvegica]|nr:hypothetical protein G7046_g9913 [Stylonectria norvegica]